MMFVEIGFCPERESAGPRGFLERRDAGCLKFIDHASDALDEVTHVEVDQ